MTKKNTIILIFSLMLAGMSLLFFSTRPAAAQDPKPTPSDDEVNRVAKQMYCPVCENTPLDVCPTQACQEWRDLIRLKLSDGWSDQQIKQYFAQQYGDRVLAEPPKTGLNWIVYILPWVAIAGGAVVVWRVLTSMRRRAVTPGKPSASAEPPSAEAEKDPYVARLEEELKKKD